MFCFDNTSVDCVTRDYNGIISTGDVLVLAPSVAGRVNLPDELRGTSDVLMRLAEFSKRKQVIIAAGMLAETGNKTYESVVVIDRGKILGVSDCIASARRGVSAGVALRRYATSMGKLAVFVGGDVRYPELWNFASAGRYVICMCGGKAESDTLVCARAFAVYAGKYVLAVFDDSKVCITPYGHLESVKQGNMTAFYLPMSLATGKKLTGRVRFVEEN